MGKSAVRVVVQKQSFAEVQLMKNWLSQEKSEKTSEVFFQDVFSALYPTNYIKKS